jgi:hypothetical protein
MATATGRGIFLEDCRSRREGQTGEEPEGFFNLTAASKSSDELFSSPHLASLDYSISKFLMERNNQLRILHNSQLSNFFKKIWIHNADTTREFPLSEQLLRLAHTEVGQVGFEIELEET